MFDLLEPWNTKECDKIKFESDQSRTRIGLWLGVVWQVLITSILNKHPKIIIGYSDMTAILLAIYAKTGITVLQKLDSIHSMLYTQCRV